MHTVKQMKTTEQSEEAGRHKPLRLSLRDSLALREAITLFVGSEAALAKWTPALTLASVGQL